MNLTNAAKVQIDGKTVSQISINGELVYDAISMLLTSSREYMLTGETATITVTSEKLKNKTIELFKVINMTRTSMGSKTTDSNGVATWDYTGSGAGEVGFIAVYDERESNMVSVDDYIPVADTVGLTISNNNVTYGTSVTLTATVKDQHNQNLLSGTVTFKDGSTTIGTGSISNGVATLSIATLGAGNHSLTSEINNKTSSSVALTVSKANTISTITPPTLYYRDEFDVSGKLTLSDGVTGIVGATVTLLWNDGSDHTATVETITGGVFSFHRDAPTSITEYTFKVTYAGDDNYNASETGTSSVTVSKELTVINITSPISPATVSGDFTITGTLKDDEGQVLESTNRLDVYVGNTHLGYTSTGSDGSFSYNVSGSSLADGSNTVKVTHTATSVYAYSSENITVIKSSYDGMSIELSAGKGILSYADSGSTPETEFATVRTQLKVGSSPASISGVPITFGVYKNDVLIGTTSVVNTDSNGQATYTYTSAGNGDVVIKAMPDQSSSLIQTYPIEDCGDYDACTSASGKWTIPSAVSSTYSSDGWLATASSYSQVKLTDKLTVPCSVEFTIKDWSTNNPNYSSVIIYQYINGDTTPSQQLIYGGGNGSSMNVLGSTVNHDIVKGAVYRIDYDSTLKVYENDVQLGSATNNISLPTRFEFHTGSGRTIQIKDVKVKPL